MKKLKTPLLFALALILPAAAAGYFTILYQLQTMEEAVLAQAAAQFGSVDLIIPIYMVQIVGYALFCGFFGCLLAQKLGIWRPFRLEKTPLLRTCLITLAAGIVFSLDYWVFGAVIPGIREATAATLNWTVVLSSVLYGGMVEEVMLRLFIMSLLAWLGWKLFFRKRETAPVGVIAAANLLSAVLFAAGHLPATAMMFGSITPMLLLRCFLLNGGFGLIFGYLYRKYGIQYAMLSHALLHVISKTIWFLFV